MVRLLAVGLALLSYAAPAAAQTVTRGSALQRTPITLAEGNDCSAYFVSAGGNFAPVINPFGATSCSYYQGFVFGNANDPRTGYVPRDGVINTVTVSSGANPAPLRFVILRQITNAQMGAVSGDPRCCFYVRQTNPMQPAPNTRTTFAVNLPVENNRQPNIITQDAIGFSAAAGGTLPLAVIPSEFNPGFKPGGVTASSFHPNLGPNNGAGTGGAFASGQYAGLEILLRYTFTPAAAVVSPAEPGVVPTDITTIGGNVLRPIGNQLDVIINCLRAVCPGRVNVLTRRPVLAAAKGKRKIRSLGSKKFNLKKGSKRKVRVKLNKLGRKLARKRSVKVKVVVTNSAGRVTRNLTLKRAKRR